MPSDSLPMLGGSTRTTTALQCRDKRQWTPWGAAHPGKARLDPARVRLVQDNAGGSRQISMVQQNMHASLGLGSQCRRTGLGVPLLHGRFLIYKAGRIDVAVRAVWQTGCLRLSAKA
jgi:hypothetical protein